MRISIVMVFFLVSLQVIAQQGFDAYRLKFVGTWSIENGSRLTTVTWNKDGTWASKTTNEGKEIFSLKGVWWAIDGKLHGVCLEASDPEIIKGEDEASKVTEITADYYVIENRNGILKKYKRVKKPA